MNIVDYKAADKEQSPCLKCPNHLNGIDKRLCLDNCQRLKAHQMGCDWTKEEVFIVPKEKDLIKTTKDFSLPDMEFEGPEEQDDIDRELERKTNPKKSEKCEKCEICGEPETEKNQLRRGVCISPCYSRWRLGKIKHPTLGVFKTMTKQELKETRDIKYTECLIPGCHEIGDRRGLCSRGGGHYKAWVKGRIEHPELGKWFPKYSATKPKPETTEDICLMTVNLDLGAYPQIKKALYKTAGRLSLPASHVIITLLAEALAERGRID